MYKLRLLNYPDHVPLLVVAKSYGIRNSIKLEVYKKISKVPSWRGLQKNHAQLHNFPEKSLVKFSRRQNFKIIMVNFKFTKEFCVIRKFHD